MVVRRVETAERHELLRGVKGQWGEQHVLDEREHRRGGTEPDRQRCDGDYRDDGDLRTWRNAYRRSARMDPVRSRFCLAASRWRAPSCIRRRAASRSPNLSRASARAASGVRPARHRPASDRIVVTDAV